MTLTREVLPYSSSDGYTNYLKSVGFHRQRNKIYSNGKLIIEGYIHCSGVEVKFVYGPHDSIESFVSLSCSGLDVGHSYSVIGMKRLVKKFIRYAKRFNEGKDSEKLRRFFDDSRETDETL